MIPHTLSEVFAKIIIGGIVLAVIWIIKIIIPDGENEFKSN
jgi:hypothetical protein